MSNPFEGFTLYHFSSCPYCIRVRDAMSDMGISFPEKDILQDPQYRQELIEGGGKSTVPCLRMDQPDGQTTWMYESLDIIDYLKSKL